VYAHIGRPKHREQESSLDKGTAENNKKTDTKSTLPREVDQVTTPKQEFFQAPFPLAATSSAVVGLEAESNLIAAIKNSINSPPVSKPSSTVPKHVDLVDFPPLPPNIKLLTNKGGNPNENKPSSDMSAPANQTSLQLEVSEESQAMDTDNNNTSTSFFVSSFPEQYPPDWSISPANNYIKPKSVDMDTVDSSLLPENER
jgi:hypothetical protein